MLICYIKKIIAAVVNILHRLVNYFTKIRGLIQNEFFFSHKRHLHVVHKRKCLQKNPPGPTKFFGFSSIFCIFEAFPTMTV